MEELINLLEDRQKDSQKYWEELYLEQKTLKPRIYEIGFYAGLQSAIDTIKEREN
jgi:hypothetical protein